MSEELPDMTLINPDGREVVVTNELGQELLQQPGFKEAGKKEVKTKEAPKEEVVAEAAPAKYQPADDAPKARGSK